MPHPRARADRPGYTAPLSDRSRASSSGASRFKLEPLAGEAQVEGRAGAQMDPAKGQVRRLPTLDPGIIRGEDRQADVIGADVVDRAALGYSRMSWPLIQ